MKNGTFAARRFFPSHFTQKLTVIPNPTNRSLRRFGGMRDLLLKAGTYIKKMCIKIRAQPGFRCHPRIFSSEGAEYMCSGKYFLSGVKPYILSPCRALNQYISYTPGFTGGYSYLATLWHIPDVSATGRKPGIKLLSES